MPKKKWVPYTDSLDLWNREDNEDYREGLLGLDDYLGLLPEDLRAELTDQDELGREVWDFHDISGTISDKRNELYSSISKEVKPALGEAVPEHLRSQRVVPLMPPKNWAQAHIEGVDRSNIQSQSEAAGDKKEHGRNVTRSRYGLSELSFGNEIITTSMSPIPDLEQYQSRGQIKKGEGTLEPEAVIKTMFANRGFVPNFFQFFSIQKLQFYYVIDTQPANQKNMVRLLA